jgi:hypothetical protein
VRGPGGYVGFRRVPAASGVHSAASGVWTLREAESLKRAGTWPVTSDDYFSSVALLLHGEGSGATIVDSSPTPKTVTAYGDATQSTTQAKWGSKSISRGTNGAVNLGVGMNGFGSADFVIEGWFYVQSVSDFNWFYGSRLTGITGGVHFNYYSGTWKSEFATGGGWLRVDNLAVPTSAWFHYAFVRSGTTVRTYINGASQGSVTVGTSALTGDTGAITLFSSATATSSSSDGVNGFVDDLRITIGTDRGYTGSTIAVPTAAFPDS